MHELKRIPLVQILTRPATVFGITYHFFALMLVSCLSITFLTKWYLLGFFLLVSLYGTGRWLATYDPQWLDGFLLLRRQCKLQKNQGYWSCRSYAPW